MASVPSGTAAALSGCYDAHRAAALSGVPRSTVYDWARKGVVVPSISPVQEKLWSYADLMALRIVAWLRRPKQSDDGVVLRASPMGRVRQALTLLEREDVDIWHTHAEFGHGSPLVVDRSGAIFVWLKDGFRDLQGNAALPADDHFGLTGPFDLSGMRGPDLIAPRPHLRIVPDKVAGEVHVADTRLTSLTLAAMVSRGFAREEVAEMYGLETEVVVEAVDLEADLSAA